LVAHPGIGNDVQRKVCEAGIGERRLDCARDRHQQDHHCLRPVVAEPPSERGDPLPMEKPPFRSGQAVDRHQDEIVEIESLGRESVEEIVAATERELHVAIERADPRIEERLARRRRFADEQRGDGRRPIPQAKNFARL
jgi:hypothetical protein